MADLNSCVLVGRLTADATMKVLPGKGTTLAQFTLANNTGWGDFAKASFIEIKYFGKGAEAVGQYLTKGKQIAVSGELSIEKWEYEGKTYSKPVITASNVQLLSSAQKKDDEPVYDSYKGQDIPF